MFCSPSPSSRSARGTCEVWRSCDKEPAMSDYVWTAAISLMLIGYLLYSLLKPEKF